METLLCVNDMKGYVKVYFKRLNLEFYIKVVKLSQIISNASNPRSFGDPEIKKGLIGCSVIATRNTMDRILRELEKVQEE